MDATVAPTACGLLLYNSSSSRRLLLLDRRNHISVMDHTRIVTPCVAKWPPKELQEAYNVGKIANLLATGPQYESIEVSGKELADLVWTLQSEALRFDTFCPACKNITTWQQLPPAGDVYHTIGVHLEKKQDALQEYLIPGLTRLLRHLEFQCARQPKHRLFAAVDLRNVILSKNLGVRPVEKATLTKFGQLPSLADLAASELEEYRKFIDEKDLKDLQRATGLAAHGIGIGSFVYLRRIFEGLVNEAADSAATSSEGFDQIAFRSMRMEDKLQAISGHVPAWMVTNRKLYGILSIGLHELTENGCIEAFSAVKQGTLALLEQHAEVHRREKRAKDAASELQKLGERLGKKA